MDFGFSGEVIYWRGPSPWHFLRVPDDKSAAITAASAELTYGWGCIPVRAVLGGTSFTTSLIPKDGGYLVPLKTAVRNAEQVELGDVVSVQVMFDA